MKNTIRASNKNTSEPKTPQGKKPSMNGHPTAYSGQIETTRGPVKTSLEGKVPYPILCLGLELGLNDEQIQAVAVIAEFEGFRERDFFKTSVVSGIQAYIEDIKFRARDGKNAEEKISAQKVLTMLKLPLPNTLTASPSLQDGLDLLLDAVRESEALDELLLCAMENDKVDAFRADNARLACGLDILMRHVKHDREMAYDTLRKATN